VNAFTANKPGIWQDFSASKATDLVDRSPPRKAEQNGAAVLAGIVLRMPLPNSYKSVTKGA